MTDATLGPQGAPPAPVRPDVPASALNARGEVDWPKLFLGFGGMVVGQFMAFLDIQIVASSLSQIQAGVGATADQISWIQTIYLLAEVVIIPVTAYLTKMWSTQKLYMGAAAAFILTSIATGLSTSFEMMVFTRALQGLAAGAMIPPVFATAMTVFPPERRVTANVIVGLIVTLAPTIGPTLGGYITEAFGWRWLFLINVGPGLLVMFLVGRFANFDEGDPSLSKGIDWAGVGLMTVFLLSMQFVLEEGASDGWFDDDLILWLTVLAFLSGVAFIWRQLTYRQPIVSLAPFGNWHFTFGVVMSFVAGFSIFGGTFILPLYLAQVLDYTAAQVGTTMVVSGIVMFITAPIAGRIVRAMDLRISMVAGFLLAAWGTGMGAWVTEDWGFSQFAWLQAVRAVGVMLAIIASQQLAVATLPPAMMKDASGLVNLVRNVGGAVGLALLTTLLMHQTAVHLGDVAAGVSATSPQGQAMLDGLTAMMRERGSSDPEAAARTAFAGMMRQQAAVLSYADAFFFLAVASAAAGFLSLFSGPARANQGPPPTPGLRRSQP